MTTPTDARTRTAPSTAGETAPGDAKSRVRTGGLFLALCILAIVAIALYVGLARPRSGPGAGPDESIAGVPTIEADAVPDGPVMLFRHAGPGPTFGHLALVPLPMPSPDPSAAPTRAISPLSCERLHYAAGHGVCMTADESRMPVRYEASLFDRRFQRTHTLPLTGPPIRARVSPDGRRAALTVFESGHSYADANFSTKTTLVDTATGALLGDLEAFAVTRNGAPFKEVDFNFWGVTFARDDDTFYATLKTGGKRYLVKGSVDARAMRVEREDVECPSLSPDGRLIVFKKPLVSEVGWRLHLLDLTTGTERPLDRLPRSIDDQVEWFDNRHIVYHDSPREGAGLWLLGVDDDTPPRLLLPGAYSPAVFR